MTWQRKTRRAGIADGLDLTISNDGTMRAPDWRWRIRDAAGTVVGTGKAKNRRQANGLAVQWLDARAIAWLDGLP